MTREYYNSRHARHELRLDELHARVSSLFALFRDRNFLKEKTGLTDNYLPNALRHEATVYLGFSPFPFDRWPANEITENNLLGMIEFLYDRVSKPGKLTLQTDESGYDFHDFESYDEEAGKAEFRQAANAVLSNWKTGYELSAGGDVQEKGTAGLQYLFDANIPALDEVNVDSQVRLAIAKWRSRRSTNTDKKEAVRILADVFEYLKKAHGLQSVLDKQDESDLFHIVNTFAIRHHNPKQKTGYDKGIWYAWMFHFYLATYHASVRLILKRRLTSSV